MTHGCIALGFSAGTGLLLYAYLFWNQSPNSQRGLVVQSLPHRYHRELTTLGAVAGMWLIIYTSLESLALYKNHIKILLTSVSGHDMKLVLGLLGIVMTITTAGVITLSRNALTDIRDERKSISDSIDSMHREIDPLPHQLKLEMNRLDLSYQNNQEIEALCLSTSNDKIEDKIQFRQQLGRFYNSPDGTIDFLNYLKNTYSREGYDRLMGAEIDYLHAIIKHYEKFPSDNQENNKNIIRLATDILKK